MAELNKLVCATDIKNTGYGSCILDLRKIIGAYEVPRGKVFTKAELATLPATLSAAIIADKAQRIYPIGGFQALTDNTEDPTFQALGYGTSVPVREGNNSWTFQYVKGGICLSNALRSRNNGYGDFLFYDDQNILFGTKKDDGTGALGLAGIPVDVFYAYPWKANDGSNVTAYRVRFDFQPQYVNEMLGYVKADFSLSTLNGLQNINLTQVNASAAGVSQIQALSGCAAENLYDLYSTELAASALWKAYNVTTGGVINITSVAANPGLKAFTVTLDSADTDYPATSTALVRIELVSPSLLAAADIVGYEGLPVTIQRG